MYFNLHKLINDTIPRLNIIIIILSHLFIINLFHLIMLSI